MNPGNDANKKMNLNGNAPVKGGRGGPPPMPMKGLAFWFLMLAMALMMYQLFSEGKTKAESFSYHPEFTELVEAGRIARCEIVREVSGQEYIRGELTDLDAATGAPRRFRVDVVVTDSLITWLREEGINFTIRMHNPVIWQLVSGILPFLIIIGIFYLVFARQMRMAGKGALSFGKSRARLLSQDKHRVTFKDVAGVDEAKDELQEVVEFLKDPKQFQTLGGKMPKGVMLAGPPGTGKTLLAKAVAGEAEVPFFTISGSDFVEMFVGVGASRVRDMFEQGKKNAPCIIFIDEIDAVGRSRFSGIGGGHDEREQTLNALLVEMDGFDTQEGVIIIAATNRPDVLDNALMRPGRFDRQVYVDLPNLEGRAAILEIHTRKIKLAADVDLKRVARGTPGFSGADLANLVNEAALLAARRKVKAVEMQDMEEARDKVCWGRERRSHALDDEEKRLTACHEAGHAIAMHCTAGTEPLHKVTVIPRGRALGSTMQLPEKDRYTNSRKWLEGLLIGMMGGRAAEDLVFGDVTTGAQNDLQQATRIARAMVCEYGMSPLLGPQNFGSNQEMFFLGREVNRTQNVSEETARKIDQEISRILKAAYDQSLKILTEKRDRLELLTDLLIEKETLDGKQVEEIIDDGTLTETAPPTPAPDPVTEPDPAKEPSPETPPPAPDAAN